MAPPIKHKTAAAKLKASREKCSRYYARCHESILAKRREKYHAAKKHQEDEDGKDGSDDDHEESLETLAECIAVVKYAKDDFVQYIQRSPQTFTIGVFAEYTKSIPDAPGSHGDREIFQRAISSIEEFLARGTQGQDGILQLCGVCDEWRALQTKSAGV
ncbi:uncharacterized protein HD556DRAFT_1441437 [Suillus plorans]|uniref:Uncharacterized protein n=1 Tax=Suillus plorans TaxID=116603 RepID=A0A9P7AXG9_9AGAM|nr:uncharacterized protein HD556DRAFT_1441437 [Suillus plorans]KAG1796738.1 hypothetical protein HD556DRAFT_1441437 [Suillus plorans]